MSTQGDELRRSLGAADLQVRTELAVEIAHRVDVEMPVDTGWARANTVLSIGVPPEGPVGDPGDPGPGVAAQAAGLAAVLANQDPTVDIVVSNHVPYVPILDATHPTAAGMLERAVEDGVAAVQARHCVEVTRI